MLKTHVYVDGFNLHYGCLRDTPYRWLDLEQQCRLLLPPNDVVRIYYCTARVGARIGDPDQPMRQQRYLRALATLPTVRVHSGHYLSHPVWMPLETSVPGGPRFARVIRTEEKGSDVNLATHLVSDACEDAFDCAVLITNDSDLREPVALVRGRRWRPPGLGRRRSPHRTREPRHPHPAGRRGAREGRLDQAAGVVDRVARSVRLGFGLGLKHGVEFNINHEQHHHDHPVLVGELQVWDVVNRSPIHHPFHLHGFFFQVLEVNGKAAERLAWEDTVNVPSSGKVRIAWYPDDRPGGWMYHCHILEHHAAGMMGHFEVVR